MPEFIVDHGDVGGGRVSGLDWSRPDMAKTAEGHFILRASPIKGEGGETLFSLSFTRTDGSRARQTYTLVGLFESPDFARRAAEIFLRD